MSEPEMLYRDDVSEVWHGDCLDAGHVAAVMGDRKADLLCLDAPYSAATHDAHNTQRNVREKSRRALDYAHWSRGDVARFCSNWLPLVSAWCVSLTDDSLFHAWRDEMAGAGMRTFQDVACVVRGMTVRLGGDGPSSWVIHAAVGRRRSKELAKWGTLDGAYSGPPEPQLCVGGKPEWLMSALVRDYSQPGALVVDPTCGAGTTLVTAKRQGRRAIGIDVDRAHADLAAKRLRGAREQASMPWAERSAG